jgi:hypothetical protein
MSIERTARRRIHLIKRADLLKSIAEGCLSDGIDSPEPSSLPHAVKCAAKLYGLAANEYRSAGLGLLARKCWREAAKNYEQLKVNEEAERCLAAAAEVQEYWEGGAS